MLRNIWTFSLSSVSVDEISGVRMGRQSEGLRKYTEEQVEGRCFSIMFKGRRKNLDLIASSEEEARKWVNSLEKIISNLNNLTCQQKTEQYPCRDSTSCLKAFILTASVVWETLPPHLLHTLMYLSVLSPHKWATIYLKVHISSSLHQKHFSWIYSCLRKADKNKDDKLSQSEVQNFLRLINLDVDDDYAEMLFKVMPSVIVMLVFWQAVLNVMFLDKQQLRNLKNRFKVKSILDGGECIHFNP